MTVAGIDISEHQETTPPLDGLGFVIVRASIGRRADLRWAMHSANVRAAGRLLGAFHFNWSPLPVADQVAAFLRIAKGVDLPLVLDVEEDRYEDSIGELVVVPAFTPAQAAEFIAGIHAAGERIWLYHSLSGFDEYLGCGQDGNWVASWGSVEPSMPHVLWQWQGDPLDSDTFAGSLDELRALAGLPDTSTGGSTVVGVKSGGPAIGFGKMAAGHQLISPQDTKVRFPSAGAVYDQDQEFSVLAILNLTDPADDAAIDIDGNKPPIASRNEVYLVDAPTFGVAALALRQDVQFTAAAAPETPAPSVPTVTLDTTTSADGQSVTVTMKKGA